MMINVHPTNVWGRNKTTINAPTRPTNKLIKSNKKTFMFGAVKWRQSPDIVDAYATDNILCAAPNVCRGKIFNQQYAESQNNNMHSSGSVGLRDEWQLSLCEQAKWGGKESRILCQVAERCTGSRGSAAWHTAFRKRSSHGDLIAR